MPERFRLHVAVYLILTKGDTILLLRRFNTGWGDGNYSLPSGHLDGKENVIDALIREAKEETGIDIERKDVRVAHVMNRNSKEREYIDFYLTADRWTGTPTNMEPDKCDDLSWCQLAALPPNMMPFVRRAIHDSRNGIHFSEFGWDRSAD